MNTTIWLMTLLTQGGNTPEPPEPPTSANVGGGQSITRFIVKGKRGTVTVSDPNLVALFLRILNQEDITEFEITRSLEELGPIYGVPLKDNIQVLSDILDKLEDVQYNVVKRKEIQESVAQVLAHREELRAFMEANKVEAQNQLQEYKRKLLEKQEAEAEEQLEKMSEGYSKFLSGIVSKWKIESRNALVQELMNSGKEERIRNKVKEFESYLRGAYE